MGQLLQRALELTALPFLLMAGPAFAQQGYLVTMGGNGAAGQTGDGGQALGASLTPTAITFDANGNIFSSMAHRFAKCGPMA